MWYVGGEDPDNRNELRHSLRSVATNAPTVTEAWVVGDVPDWFAGVKVPLKPLREKFANARQSITRFANLPAAPDEFYLFMDDIYITEPVTGQLPTCHLGPARNYGPYLRGRGAYSNGVRHTTDWLHTHGHPDPLAYLAHTPVLLNTQRTRAFLNEYPQQPLEPFLLYNAAGANGEGRRSGNSKCKAPDNLEHKMALDIPYLSSAPDTWAGKLGDIIRKQFPTPSRWETSNG